MNMSYAFRVVVAVSTLLLDAGAGRTDGGVMTWPGSGRLGRSLPPDRRSAPPGET